MAKHYLVSGTRTFQGHEPGETFEADITEAEEARYIARGSITEASGDTTKDLSALTREELDELARNAGVENPEGLSNKDEVIAAIETHNTSEESGGEGEE